MKLKELAEKAGLVIVDYLQESFVRVYDIWTDEREILIDGCSKKQARAFLRGYIAAQKQEQEPVVEKKEEQKLPTFSEVAQLADNLDMTVRLICNNQKFLIFASYPSLVPDFLFPSSEQAWNFLQTYEQARKAAQDESNS